jgi:hypothetical protein
MDRRSIWRLLQVVKGISIAKQVTLVLTVWFAIAVFSSASGATLALRPPFPQVVLCGILDCSLSHSDI